MPSWVAVTWLTSPGAPSYDTFFCWVSNFRIEASAAGANTREREHGEDRQGAHGRAYRHSVPLRLIRRAAADGRPIRRRPGARA